MDPHWDNAARGVSPACRARLAPRRHLPGRCWKASPWSRPSHRPAARRGDRPSRSTISSPSAAVPPPISGRRSWPTPTGRPVKRSTTVEASSLGAAMAAAKGAGWFRPSPRPRRRCRAISSRAFEPDPGRATPLPRAPRHPCRSLADPCRLEPPARRFRGARRWLRRPNWNALIEDVVAGRWRDPETRPAGCLALRGDRAGRDDRGREGGPGRPARARRRLAVVSDVNTVEVMGRPRRRGRCARSPRSTRW